MNNVLTTLNSLLEGVSTLSKIVYTTFILDLVIKLLAIYIMFLSVKALKKYINN